ncbi:MAG: acyl-ACP--UDP-N-acetylglucosamine O-acyltransferase [Thermoanaerobaculia bacterium]
MTASVHPSAAVSPQATLAEGVTVGPFAVVGDGVVLGKGTSVGAHASIEGPAVLGEGNRVFAHAVLGFEPQDLTYQGEPTRLKVGDHNVFREFSTVHRGTATGHGETVVGSHNYFMAYTHIAHDNVIGSHCVIANCASLAGHVEVGDWVNIGAFTVAHQFVRIGSHAFLGAYSGLRRDALPFCRTDGLLGAKTYGINTIGLRRRGFSDERIEALQRAYRLLVRSKLNTSQALEKIEEELKGQPDVEDLVAFIKGSQRGFHR